MKKIFMLLLAAGALASVQVNGQTVLEKASKTAQSLDVLPIENVGETANGIMGLLKPKLSLNDAQSPKVLGLVTDFLGAKSSITSLAKTDPAGYTSKFGGLKEKLMSGLKTVLTVAQYKNMLGLKPKTSSAGNLLSHLFF